MLRFLRRSSGSISGASLYLWRRVSHSLPAPDRKSRRRDWPTASLLMKLNLLVSRLALNDISETPGSQMKSATFNTKSKINAGIGIAPKNPVKFTVPVAAEVFKNMGIYDEKKLVGMTTLESRHGQGQEVLYGAS